MQYIYNVNNMWKLCWVAAFYMQLPFWTVVCCCFLYTSIHILEICVHLLLWIINSTECMVYTSKYSPLCFSPRVHGGDNDVGNLIVSECLPETSRPALYFSDDYSNINYVSNSSEIGSFPSHATGVRSVEMNRVWCNVIGYELLWNYSLKILSPAVII